MAKPQENSVFMTSISPIREHEEANDIDDYEEEIAQTCGCGCFRFFCFQLKPSKGGQQRRFLLQQKDEQTETWFIKKVKNMREVSELIAGPKWKNFIRKIGKCFNKKKTRTQFHYDSHSYGLNFDNGEEEEDDGLLFKSRFAPPFSGQEKQAGL